MRMGYPRYGIMVVLFGLDVLLFFGFAMTFLIIAIFIIASGFGIAFTEVFPPKEPQLMSTPCPTCG